MNRTEVVEMYVDGGEDTNDDVGTEMEDERIIDDTYIGDRKEENMNARDEIADLIYHLLDRYNLDKDVTKLIKSLQALANLLKLRKDWPIEELHALI